jgi:hypothetical protein
MQQAFLGQNRGIGQPACCFLILMATDHRIQKVRISGGYPKIDCGHSTGGVGCDVFCKGVAVFDAGAEDAVFKVPIRIANKARRRTASGCGDCDMTARR